MAKSASLTWQGDEIIDAHELAAPDFESPSNHLFLPL
jgi:hypothetical protein